MKLATPLATQSPSIQLEDFRGDTAQVAALIQQSWRENGKQGLLYTPEFLSSCLSYPGSMYSLAPTLYQGESPLAFIAGFPRSIRYQGHDLKVILSTLLSVSNQYKKAGYGVMLWSELVKRAQSGGYSGMVNYCIDGEPMNSMIMGCCRLLKMPTERIFSVQYLMRLLQPKIGTSPQENDSENDLTEEFLSAAALIGNDVSLSRIWTAKEAQWQLQRQDAVVAFHRADPQKGQSGLITGYLMHAANPQKTKCLLIEDVLWGTLENEHRFVLVQKMLGRAAQAGAQIALLPCLGYADIAPFRAARFRSSPRTLHCYLTIFTGNPTPTVLPSMYLDVV